jgi:hypothetical protein
MSMAMSVGIGIAIGAGIGTGVGAYIGIMRFGFNTSGMWETTGKGSLIGGIIGASFFLGAHWIVVNYSSFTSLGTIWQLGTHSWQLGLSLFGINMSIAYLFRSRGADKPWVKIEPFSVDEAKYLQELIRTIKNACDDKNITHHLATMTIVGIFKGDTEFDGASATLGRPWSLYGPHVVLAEGYFDRHKNPEYQHDAFKSQIITLLHEAYHTGTWDFTEKDAHGISPDDKANKIWEQIKNSQFITDFEQNVYIPFKTNRK